MPSLALDAYRQRVFGRAGGRHIYRGRHLRLLQRRFVETPAGRGACRRGRCTTRPWTRRFRTVGCLLARWYARRGRSCSRLRGVPRRKKTIHPLSRQASRFEETSTTTAEGGCSPPGITETQVSPRQYPGLGSGVHEMVVPDQVAL